MNSIPDNSNPPNNRKSHQAHAISNTLKRKFLEEHRRSRKIKLPVASNSISVKSEAFKNNFKNKLKEKLNKINIGEKRSKKLGQSVSLASLAFLRNKHVNDHSNIFYKDQNSTAMPAPDGNDHRKRKKLNTDRTRHRSVLGFSFPKTDKVTIIEEIMNKYPNKEQEYIDLNPHYAMSEVRKPNIVHYKTSNPIKRAPADIKSTDRFEKFMRVQELTGMGNLNRPCA